MVRKANINDIKDIHELINHFAGTNKMLARSLSELYETARDFLVYESKGKVCGCCALHLDWESLAEIKSLAVWESSQDKGVGRRLLKASLKEAKKLAITKVFALTYEADFFRKYGFREVNKSELPHKIWSECLKCPKFPDCDETALVIDL